MRCLLALPIVALALFAAACTPAELTAPPGFAQLDDPGAAYSYRAMSADGVVVAARAEKNLARRLVVDRSLSTTEAGGGGSERADAGSPILSVDDAEWNVPGGKIFVATLIEPEHAGDRPKLDDARRAKRFAVEALAVKSTGSLVDGDSARFCGVLTGVVQAASEIHLVHRAVGMFDLPENTGAAPHTGSPTP